MAGTSAMWDREVTIIFCDLCVREVEVGNRPTTFFNKEGWGNILVKFKEMTGRDYDRMKMKNKWDQLKKDWKLWKELKQGSTGMGWDPVKRTIDAPEEWWAEKLQVLGVREYHNRRPPHMVRVLPCIPHPIKTRLLGD
ncbi:L10-interacting MYB domain-containing protein-like [Phalaenopsis equestris]|uniref:L10-interacting MYB domain-containing protein-like n=1 Tax=Phalaenopsis equestris TaxID=78828 RepID=UPI0009E50393|nr:L10-interacting MYB domain-containing protein-like [Phalaenopsis equestris]